MHSLKVRAMNRKRIKTALTAPIGGREVMTLAEFCKAWGCKDKAYTKKKYGLDKLEMVDGRYYVDDLVELIVDRSKDNDELSDDEQRESESVS